MKYYIYLILHDCARVLTDDSRSFTGVLKNLFKIKNLILHIWEKSLKSCQLGPLLEGWKTETHQNVETASPLGQAEQGLESRPELVLLPDPPVFKASHSIPTPCPS